MENSYSEIVKNALKEAISSAIYSCEDYAEIEEDLNTADNMQDTFCAWVNEDFREIVNEHGFSDKLEKLKDKCAKYFEERIYDAVESALSVAREAMLEDLADIEQELFDIVDKQELGE